jgi:hypothetical protein
MRGRTNTNLYSGVALNADTDEYKIVGDDIVAGDFVTLSSTLEADMLINTDKSLINSRIFKINDDIYAYCYSLTTSNYNFIIRFYNTKLNKYVGYATISNVEEKINTNFADNTLFILETKINCEYQESLSLHVKFAVIDCSDVLTSTSDVEINVNLIEKDIVIDTDVNFANSNYVSKIASLNIIDNDSDGTLLMFHAFFNGIGYKNYSYEKRLIRILVYYNKINDKIIISNKKEVAYMSFDTSTSNKFGYTPFHFNVIGENKNNDWVVYLFKGTLKWTSEYNTICEDDNLLSLLNTNYLNIIMRVKYNFNNSSNITEDNLISLVTPVYYTDTAYNFTNDLSSVISTSVSGTVFYSPSFCILDDDLIFVQIQTNVFICNYNLGTSLYIYYHAQNDYTYLLKQNIFYININNTIVLFNGKGYYVFTYDKNENIIKAVNDKIIEYPNNLYDCGSYIYDSAGNLVYTFSGESCYFEKNGKYNILLKNGSYTSDTLYLMQFEIDGILLKGLENNVTVKKASDLYANGVAKESGTAGDTISVYVPR